MWRNYIQVAVQTLLRNRLYAAINIIGLALGMAACLMILLFVRYELSYDRDLRGSADIYQAQMHYADGAEGKEMSVQMAPYVAKAAMMRDFPQVRAAVFFVSAAPLVLKNGRALTTRDTKFVDGPVFDVLPFPLVAGDPRTALAAPGDLVLTQSEARRLFGRTSVLGEKLIIVSRGRNMPFRVTGVLRDRPRNTHMPLSILARIDMNQYFDDQRSFMTGWGETGGWTYYRLAPGSDVAAINAALPAWEKRHIPDQNVGPARFNIGELADFRLLPMREVHLGAVQSGAMAPGNDRGTIAAFALIAALIMVMACVNFTNLATARATQRAREVALRKVLGARRRQIVAQFLGESIVIAAAAMLLALAIVELALPLVSDFLAADLVLHYRGRDGVIVPVLVLTLLVGIAGGAYPAFFLSRFQPAQILKANKSAADAPGSGWLRNLLVVAQFAVSIALMICTAVIHAQTIYARTADPGFRRDHLLQIQNIGRYQLRPVLPELLSAIADLPGVISIGRGNIAVATEDWGATGVVAPGAREQISIGSYAVDAGYFPTLGAPILAGRVFDARRPADHAETPTPENPAAERAFVARGANVVINARAVERLGFASPSAAIGRTIQAGLVDERYGGVVPARIIGVVGNVRLRSIREPEEAILYTLNRKSLLYLIVRHEGNGDQVRARIERLWRRIAPHVPFVAEEAEARVATLYAQDVARATVFAGFSVLAIVIGCLGLFGLSAFAAERRTKEIGIRKALGARTSDLIALLAWQFSKPVMAANLIAWPCAWWMMRDWLKGFDERIALNPLLFAGAGGLAMAIALMTITAHAFRVARISPAASLRYE